MLILSRKVGQGIRIGDAISVTVVAVDGGYVRLGLDAPAAYKILREELWRSVARDNAEAASTSSAAFAQLVKGAGEPDPEGSWQGTSPEGATLAHPPA